MTLSKRSPEFMDQKCDSCNTFYDIEDVSNIRPSYQRKVANEYHTGNHVEEENINVAQNTPTEFLGYDWIASMIDNQMRAMYSNILKKHNKTSVNSDIVDEQWLNQPELFENLSRFRQANSDLCCSQQPVSYNKVCTKVNPPRSASTRVRQLVRPIPPVRTKFLPNSSSRPPVIYSYTLNSRLFPVRTDILADNEKAECDANNSVILSISIPSHRLKSMKISNVSSDYHKKHITVLSHRPGNTISLIDHCY
ncbi:unnamed protein product [Heterobilharzia americana]|nr:unnamed protein product [Heterobilharzia americana]